MRNKLISFNLQTVDNHLFTNVPFVPCSFCYFRFFSFQKKPLKIEAAGVIE